MRCLYELLLTFLVNLNKGTLCKDGHRSMPTYGYSTWTPMSILNLGPTIRVVHDSSWELDEHVPRDLEGSSILFSRLVGPLWGRA